MGATATREQVRADPHARIVFLLEIQDALDLDTEATSTLRFSSGDLPAFGAYPAHQPYLEGSLRIRQSVIDGEALGGASRLDGAGPLVLRNDIEMGGSRPLDSLRRVELSGRALELSWVGHTRAGEWMPYSARGTVFSGIVGERPTWGRRIEIPVRPEGDGLEQPFGEVYLGLDKALLLVGTRGVDVGNVWTPAGSFWIQAFVYIASGETGAKPIVHKSGAYVLEIDYSGAEPVAKWTVTTATSSGSISSPAAPELDRFFWVTATYNATTGVGDVRLDAGTPLGFTISGGGAVASNSNKIFLGENGTGSAVYRGVFAEVRFADGTITDNEIAARIRGPLPLSTSGLVAYWRGDCDAAASPATLFDSGPNAYDGTVITPSSASMVSTLEGGEALEGTPKPVALGFCDNFAPRLPAPGFLVYQFSRRSSLGEALGGTDGGADALTRRFGFFDRAAPLELEAVHLDFVNFWRNPPTMAGKYTWFPALSLARPFGIIDGGKITASTWGQSPWRFSAQTDGAAGSVRLAAAWRGLIAPTGAEPVVTVEMWVFVDTDEDDHIVLDSRKGDGGVRIRWRSNSPGQRFVFQAEDSAGTLVIDQNVTGILPRMPYHVAWTLENSGGSCRSAVKINGLAAADTGLVSGTIAEGTAANPLIGNSIAGGKWGRVSVSQLRAWAAERSEAEVQQYLLTSPAGKLEPDLAALLGDDFRRGGASTHWFDEEGSADGELLSVSHVGGGVPPSLPYQAMHAAALAAGIPEADLSITSSARSAGGNNAAIGLHVAREMPALEVISEAGRGAGLHLIFDRSAGAYVIDRLEAPGAATHTFEAWEIADFRQQGYDRPAHSYQVGYGPIWEVMEPGDIALSVSDARRAYLEPDGDPANRGPRVRYAAAPRPANESAYPLAQMRQDVLGLFLLREAAETEAERLAALQDGRPEGWLLELKRGLLEAIRPLSVVTVKHDLLAGGTGKFIVLAPEDSGAGRSSIGLWGPF